jgi:glutaredoxin
MVTKPKVTLYTRRGCCLCEDVKEVLVAAQSRASFDYEEFDIDADEELCELYNEDVPVVNIDGKRAFKHRVDMTDFLKRLARR